MIIRIPNPQTNRVVYGLREAEDGSPIAIGRDSQLACMDATGWIPAGCSVSFFAPGVEYRSILDNSQSLLLARMVRMFGSNVVTMDLCVSRDQIGNSHA